MLKNNIKYKQVVRLQLFGDDNVYNKVQYQYSTMGTLSTSLLIQYEWGLIWEEIWGCHTIKKCADGCRVCIHSRSNKYDF